MLVFLIIALILAILALVFALQNTASITLAFLLWHFQGSLALVVIVALLAGVVIALLALLPTFIRGRSRTVGHIRREAELQGALDEHRRRLDELQHAAQEPSKAEQDQPSPQS